VGVFLAVLTAFHARADVLYSFSQPASGAGAQTVPAVNFDFTTPSLLTTLTMLPGSSVDAPLVHWMGLDLSILSVLIDPGLNNDAYWIRPGVPFIGIRMGLGNQEVLSEGMCFVPDHFGCTASPDAQIFDHFGTYTVGDTSLTISSTDSLQTATPEPRFETAAGLVALLTTMVMACRARHIVTT
jgi:hypothetical protein